MTARRVAAHRAAFPRVDAPYGRPRDDQALQESIADGVSIDTTTLMARYLRVRTRCFDQAVVDAIAAGTRQFVAAGAGYDGRGLRYDHPDVCWFELDHPDTQSDKRAHLAVLAIDAARIGFAAADFCADDVAAARRGVGHDPDVATQYLCEGVAAYLTTEVLGSLLASLRATAAPGSTLTLSISLDAEPGGTSETRVGLRRAVASMGEQLRSSLPRSGVRSWFSGNRLGGRARRRPRGHRHPRERAHQRIRDRPSGVNRLAPGCGGQRVLGVGQARGTVPPIRRPHVPTVTLSELAIL